MRVLFVGESDDMYFRNLLLWLRKSISDLDAEIITRRAAGETDVPLTEHIVPANSYLSKIPKIRSIQSLVGMRRIINKFDRTNMYDIIHVLGADPALSFLAGKLARRCKGLLTTIYGSDFYRTSAFVRLIQRGLYDASDAITLNNPQTIAEFNSYYDGRYSDKIRLARFGIAPVDAMKSLSINKEKAREMLSIPGDAVVVTIGTNGSPAQQHESIIRAIAQHRERLPQNAFFLLPMTYACGAPYRERISVLMTSCGFTNFRVLSSYLSDEEVAMLRCSTDILLHLQKTDQLSGAMQEQFYAGGLVITGDWLPYRPFDERGIFMLKAKSIEDAAAMLPNAVSNLENYKLRFASNTDRIWEMSSWESNIKTWTALYEDIGWQC